ncbi:MAG: hypothetical protein HGA22_03800 [Clostridiales bacterium]|nr:hypothetical protein [Clostridiales bacterium]
MAYTSYDSTWKRLRMGVSLITAVLGGFTLTIIASLLVIVKSAPGMGLKPGRTAILISLLIMTEILYPFVVFLLTALLFRILFVGEPVDVRFLLFRRIGSLSVSGIMMTLMSLGFAFCAFVLSAENIHASAKTRSIAIGAITLAAFVISAFFLSLIRRKLRRSLRRY